MPKLRKRKKGRAVIKKKVNAMAEADTEEISTLDTTLSDSDDSIPLSKYFRSNTSKICDTKDTSDTVDSTETIPPKLCGIISGNTSQMPGTKNTSDIVDPTEAIHPKLSGADNVANITKTDVGNMSQMHDSKATNDIVTKGNSTETINPKQIDDPRVRQSTNAYEDTKDSYIPMKIDDQLLSTETITIVNPLQDMPKVSDLPSSDSIADADNVTKIINHPHILDTIINPTEISHDDFEHVSGTPLHALEKDDQDVTQLSGILLTEEQESAMSNKSSIAQTEKVESYVNQQSDLAQIGNMTAKNEEEIGVTEKSDLAQTGDMKSSNKALLHTEIDCKIHPNNPSLKDNSNVIVEMTDSNMALSVNNTITNDPTNRTDMIKSDDTVQVNVYLNTEINMTPSIDDNLKIIDQKCMSETTKSDTTMQAFVNLNTETDVTPFIANVKICDRANTTKSDDTVLADVDLNTKINETPSINDDLNIINTKNTTATTKSDVILTYADLNAEVNVSSSIYSVKIGNLTNYTDTIQADVDLNTKTKVTPHIANVNISDATNTIETTNCDNTVRADVDLDTKINETLSIDDDLKILGTTNTTDTTKSDDTVQVDVDMNTEINITPSFEDNHEIIGPKNALDTIKSDDIIIVDIDLSTEITERPSIDNVKTSIPTNFTDTVQANVDLKTETNVIPFIPNVKISDLTNNTDTTKSDVTVQMEVDSNTEISKTTTIDNNLKISEPKKATDTTKSDETMLVDLDLNPETNVTSSVDNVKICDPTNTTDTNKSDDTLYFKVDVDMNTEINMTPSVDDLKICVPTTSTATTKNVNTVKIDVDFNKRNDTTINSAPKILEPSDNYTTEILNVTKSDNAVQSLIPSLNEDIKNNDDTSEYNAVAQIGDLLQIVDTPEAKDITKQDTTNVAKIKETSQARCDVIEIDSDHSSNDAGATEVRETADPGVEEHQKSLINKKQRKWLLYQERLKQKYGISAEDGNKSDLSKKKVHNSNSEILNTPEKSDIPVQVEDSTLIKNQTTKLPDHQKEKDSERSLDTQNNVDNSKFGIQSESSSSTADRNVIDPASGLQKYLQLMNLLNKNPEKCKKWLENQENQKQKLGDKYKEPTIYSTVKLIALGQANAMSQPNDDKSKPKVTNSLELLNVLYLNPDKCYSWLQKQENVKMQEGNLYQEPVIYPTVKLIALHHSKQENAKLSQATVPDPKKNYKGSDNQLTLAQTPKIISDDKQKATTPIIKPSSTHSKITPADMQKAPTPKLTPNQATTSLTPKITPADQKKATTPITSPSLTPSVTSKITRADTKKVPTPKLTLNQATTSLTPKITPTNQKKATTPIISPSLTPSVTSKTTSADTKKAPTPKITPNQSTTTLTPQITPADTKKITPEKSTPSPTHTISSIKTTTPPSQKSTAAVRNFDAKKTQEAKNNDDRPITDSTKLNEGISKNINKSSGEKGDLVYILFTPNSRFGKLQTVIYKQKQLRAILGSKYAIPKYNLDGSKSYNTDTSKWVVRIPYQTKIRVLKYKMDLPEKYALDWIETQIHLIEKLGNKYQPEECNPAKSINQPSQQEISFQGNPLEGNTYPSKEFAPQEHQAPQVNPYVVPAEHFYQQPSGYYEQNYYPPAADYYGSGPLAPGYYDHGIMDPSTNYHQHPSYFGSSVLNPGLPNPSGFVLPTPYADPSYGQPGVHDIAPPGVYPQASYPPLPLEGPPMQSSYTYPLMEPAKVVENKPLELYSDIPLPSTDAINASMNTVNTTDVTTAETTQKSNDIKKDSSETQAVRTSPAKTPPLKTTPKVSVFSMDQCSGNIAFRFKGNDIYYPSHIKDRKKRKVWVDQQLVIYIKKGDQYTPPEFDNKGKLIPQKIELPSTTDSKIPSISKSSDPKEAEILTSKSEDPAVKKVMESIMGNKFTPVFDKFGMRINPKYAPAEKPKEHSSREYGSEKRKESDRSREREKPKIIERSKGKEMSDEREQPRKIQKTSKPEKPKHSLEEVFSKKTGTIAPPPEKSKIAVKLKKDEKPKESKTKPIVSTSTKLASAVPTICPSIRLAHQIPSKLSGVPRAMASTWFDASETTDNKKVQSAPAPKPDMPVMNIPVPAPLAPSTITPAPSRKRPLTPSVPPPPPIAFTQPLRSTKVEETDTSRDKSKTSAFQRLGPPTEAKKPKLTINLMFVKDEKAEVVREVVEEHVPVYLRQDVIKSKDEIVQQYLKIWPWTRSVPVMKECSYASRDIVLDEIEMSTYYASKSAWIKVVVTGYPPNFKKEEVLDLLLDFVKPREFIPCFIEFKQKECVFLLNRCEEALSYLHSNGLIVKHDKVHLKLTICQTNLTLDSLRFYKGAIFKTKLTNSYDKEKNSLNLSAFQQQSDNSHFMYFPLNVTHNQIFVMNVVKAILQWRSITTLNLSGNKLTSINAFNLSEYLPSLRILDLSNNCLPTVSTLACFKGVPMYSLALDGNPLCHNFVQRDHYIDVVKLIFPRLIVLDGISVDSKVQIKKNFCVSPDAIELVNSFLEIFFTLIDSNDRMQMESLYSDSAVFSITCRPEMKRNPVYHNLKEFYMWCRSLSDRINPLDPLEGTIVGGPKIARYFTKWPVVAHDPHSFTIDVMHHTETSTVLKVTGLFKIPAETLTQDEPIIEFSRTFVLVTADGIEYKVTNEMMYISEATPERAGTAFQSVGIQQRNIDSLSLKFDSPPDEDLKEKLTEIMMRLTSMKCKPSRRCLDMVNWDLKKALAYFIRLEKLGSAGTLDF